MGERIPLSTGSPEARRLYEEAVDLLDKQRHFDAAHLFGLALQHDPELALAHRGLALSLPNSRRRLQALDRALALAGSASEGEQLLIEATKAGFDGMVERQRLAYEALVERYPEDPRSHYLLANFRFREADFESAIASFERCLEIDPEYAPGFNLLGYALRELGRFEEAEAAFLRYIEVWPDEANPRDSHAELLLKLGRFEESITRYREALDRNPGFVPSFVGIGNNLMFLGRGEEAREVFRELFEIARSEAERREAVQWMTASRLHEGDLEGALEEACELLALAEEDEDPLARAEGLALTGRILLAKGDLDAAAGRFDQAVAAMDSPELSDEVKQRSRLAYGYLQGRLSLAAGALDDAEAHVADLRQAMTDSPYGFDMGWLEELEGRLLMERGEWDSAVDSLVVAHDRSLMALYLTAQARRHQGRDDEALELGRRVVDYHWVAPDYAFVRPLAQTLVREIEGARVAATNGGSATETQLGASAQDALETARRPARQ